MLRLHEHGYLDDILERKTSMLPECCLLVDASDPYYQEHLQSKQHHSPRIIKSGTSQPKKKLTSFTS